MIGSGEWLGVWSAVGSAVLQLVFLFCSDNVSYQCKSWSDILQGWSDMYF